MHRGCALLATDIFDLLDFPDLSSISIMRSNTQLDENSSWTSHENANTLEVKAIVANRNYDDLFGDNAEISSKTANLFDDYPKPSSGADDLFSDYQKTTSSDNIFDDYKAQDNTILSENEDAIIGDNIGNENLLTKGSSHSLVTHFKLQDAIRIGFETRQLIVLKKCVIMRILAVR